MKAIQTLPALSIGLSLLLPSLLVSNAGATEPSPIPTLNSQAEDIPSGKKDDDREKEREEKKKEREREKKEREEEKLTG